MDWTDLAHVVNAVMNLRFYKIHENFLTGCRPVNFLRRALFHGVSYTVI
jgi:hypothetical protein